MITEDYVSFETAKLLKENGFDEKSQKVYMRNGQLLWAQIFMEGESFVNNKDIDLVANYNDWDIHTQGEYAYPCPTLQMAMKWLREVHNLCIEPYRTASGYLYTISKIWTGSEIYSDEFNGDDEDSGQWTTYEKACEAAIKYCLEKLI